jgi:phosphate transport system protein
MRLRSTCGWRRDEELDQMYTSLFRELMTHILEDPRHLSTGTHVLFIARDLERIGDHATNIAEMVRYAVVGTRQTERRRTADQTKSMLVTGASRPPGRIPGTDR